MHMETERAQALATASEKKQKSFEKVVTEWKLKVDDLTHDVEASRKECSTYSTELFRVKACYDESIEHLDQMRRENKNFSEEIKDLMEQICEGGRNITDISKNVKKLEIENEELNVPTFKRTIFPEIFPLKYVPQLYSPDIFTQTYSPTKFP